MYFATAHGSNLERAKIPCNEFNPSQGRKCGSRFRRLTAAYSYWIILMILLHFHLGDGAIVTCLDKKADRHARSHFL